MKFTNKKLLKYLPQIIAMLFLAGFVAYAWTEPASVPPDGNVAAPINVSGNDQTFLDTKTLWMKSDETGAMNLNGAFNVKGVSQFLNDAIFDKDVCIGGVCESAWPESQPRKAIFSVPGIYSFSVPSDITKVWVTLAGGGGGGGGGSPSSSGSGGCAAGGGGGGDAVIIKELIVAPGAGYTITVGQGGPGGTSSITTDPETNVVTISTTAGGDGSASSFGSLLITQGGKGGGAGNVSPCFPVLGGATGGPGGVKGSPSSGSPVSGGDGGGSIFGPGGPGGCCAGSLGVAVSGNTGGGLGSGGGGGSGIVASGSQIGGQGAPGSPGFIIIDY